MSTTNTRGARVARRREALGKTQEDLAQLCGCRLRTIQRVESDKNGGLSQWMIEALHKHLQMPLRELVHEQRSTRRA